MDNHEEQTTWPPPVEREIVLPPVASAGQRRTVRGRWYYTVMAAFFVWLFHLEWRRFGGPVLNIHTLTAWIGTPLFCWRAARAWALYLRTKNGQ